MSYQVLSLKWRPQTFQDVIGQEHVTRTLTNAFKTGRIAQAYLFTGPRGIGKTTTARILAKALNCLQSENGIPCDTCTNCLEIIDSRNMDVLEIDGASNRGIEEIRNLREQIKYTPMNARYKIFIIDEVHMLTTPAFNALLRTLEEPPEHGKFILATTDVHKVPATIISRCQRFDFNRITMENIRDRVQHILNEESITIDDESLKALARKADGSMRDALSILDQLIAYSGETIQYEDAVTVLGLIPYDLYFSFTDSVHEKDSGLMVRILQEIRTTGMPVSEVASGLNEHVRNLLYSSVKGGSDLLDVSTDLQERYQVQSKNWDRRDLLRMAQILADLEAHSRRASQPYILLEMTSMKLLEMDASVSISELLRTLPKREKRPPATPARTEVRKPEKEKPVQPDQVKKPETSTPGEKQEQGTPGPSQPAVELSTVQNQWESIIQAVLKKRNSVGTILEHGRPVKLDQRLLEVIIDDQPKFSLSMMEKNRAMVEATLEEQLGSVLRVKFKMGNGGSKKVSGDPEQKKTDLESPDSNEQATVSRIIELFDGEIIK